MWKGKSNLLLLGGVATLGLILYSSSSKASGGGTNPNNDTTQPDPNYSKSPTDFIKNFYRPALAVYNVSGFPIVNTLAQAGVESGWGKSVYGWNFFGIKADSGWTGGTQLLRSWECGRTGEYATKF
jgi:flagellum-specific peptidoglycan hydrolase FlgJ